MYKKESYLEVQSRIFSGGGAQSDFLSFCTARTGRDAVLTDMC